MSKNITKEQKAELLAQSTIREALYAVDAKAGVLTVEEFEPKTFKSPYGDGSFRKVEFMLDGVKVQPRVRGNKVVDENEPIFIKRYVAVRTETFNGTTIEQGKAEWMATQS